eukprot:COSAG06_NODE_1748_length_8478_cov_16.692923_5_plen_190_part_00
MKTDYHDTLPRQARDNRNTRLAREVETFDCLCAQRRILADISRGREVEVRAEQARQAALDAAAARERRAARQRADGLDFEPKILAGEGANLPLPRGAAAAATIGKGALPRGSARAGAGAGAGGEVGGAMKRKEEALRAMERAHAKVRRNVSFWRRLLLYCIPNICQDRLGTNIGKLSKKGRFLAGHRGD